MPVKEDINKPLIDLLYTKINEWLPAELKNSAALSSIFQSVAGTSSPDGIEDLAAFASHSNDEAELPALEAVLNASNNGVLIIDQTAKIRFVNKKAAEKLGWSPLGKISKYLSAELTVSDSKPDSGRSVLDLGKTAENNQTGYRIEYLQEGFLQKIDLLVNISEIPHFREVLYVISIRDISKEVEFEQELKRQKKFTEDVLNNLPADIAVFDKDHRYLFVNPWAIRDDTTREWIIGKTDYDYFAWKGKSPDSADERHRYFMESVNTCKRVQYVDKIQSPSGQLRYVLRNYYPYVENGSVKYVFGYAIDVTEMHETQDRLNDTLISLETINSELEHIAYIISHDLQEPLRMVKSFIQLLELKLGPVLDDTDRQYIGFAKAGTERMKIHIKDLLDYSKIGKKKEEVQDISLNEVIAELKIVFQLSITESNAEIITGDLGVIRGYREGIYHLFQNLLGNAIKYRDAAKPKNIIQIGCEEYADRWELFISDNGVGVDPKYFEKIFQLFQRLDGDKSGKKGTGVGLAICKKIVELHNGNIRLESKPGEGTVFYITIPKNMNQNG